MNSNEDIIRTVINGFSELIRQTRQRISSEERQPSRDADQSDEWLKDEKKRLIILNRLRFEFEEEIYKF